jgi:hypothetical protein
MESVESPEGVLVATSSNLHKLVDGRFSIVRDVVEKSDELDHVISGRRIIWLGCSAVIKVERKELTRYTAVKMSSEINRLYEDRDGTLGLPCATGPQNQSWRV